MTGFIRGLFGGNGNKDKESEPNRQPQRQSEAFFLDADDAKTLGDVEFMRKPFEIERSFPKVRNRPGFSIVKTVTANEETMAGDRENNRSQTSNNSTASTPPSAAADPPRRNRSADSNMDMFRKMAKDMKR